MKSIPRSIRIGAKRFTVRTAPLSAHTGFDGRTDYVHRRITIETSLPYAEQLATLIHEAVHVINDRYVTGLDESQVARLANGVEELLGQLRE